MIIANAVKSLEPASEFLIENEDYSTIQWIVSPKTIPTEAEVNTELIRLKAAFPLQELREKRNVLLASSDWTGLSDTALTNEKLAEWKLYRQHLRNLPDGLDTEDKVKEATWPEKPA